MVSNTTKVDKNLLRSNMKKTIITSYARTAIGTFSFVKRGAGGSPWCDAVKKKLAKNGFKRSWKCLKMYMFPTKDTGARLLPLAGIAAKSACRGAGGRHGEAVL